MLCRAVSLRCPSCHVGAGLLCYQTPTALRDWGCWSQTNSLAALSLCRSNRKKKQSPTDSHLGQDLAKKFNTLARPCLPYEGSTEGAVQSCPRACSHVRKGAQWEKEAGRQRAQGSTSSSLQLAGPERAEGMPRPWMTGGRKAAGENQLVSPSSHLLVCSLLWPEVWLLPPESRSPPPCPWRAGL